MIIEIPITPRTKKNSSRVVYVHGRIMVIPSKNYKDYEKACKDYIPKINDPIDYPVNVKCTYYMPTRRRIDLVNLIEASMDILVKYKVLSDDNSNIVVSHDGSRVYYDKDNGRCIIEITKKESN
jgi:Holliday junction resolvase RusA-like endonuclease